MWSMPVVLTETENDNDSVNQNYFAKMTLPKGVSPSNVVGITSLLLRIIHYLIRTLLV